MLCLFKLKKSVCDILMTGNAINNVKKLSVVNR